MNERTKRISGSTIAIIVLAILLVLSVVGGIVLAYFSSDKNVTGNITLGDPVTISITQGGSSVESLTFDGDALPGTVYKQAIGVEAPASMTTALLRAKVTISRQDLEGGPVTVEATTDQAWKKHTDDYYYYYGQLEASQKADFITAITVPTSLTNTEANKTYVVNIIVEAIQQANNAANSVWEGAPEEWLNTYSPAAAGINMLQQQPIYSNNPTDNTSNFNNQEKTSNTRRNSTTQNNLNGQNNMSNRSLMNENNLAKQSI